MPPKALADACMAAHVRLRQARFVVPALAALERPRALSLLPKLAPLDAVMFKAAMHRLMLTQPGTGTDKSGLKLLVYIKENVGPQKASRTHASNVAHDPAP